MVWQFGKTASDIVYKKIALNGSSLRATTQSSQNKQQTKKKTNRQKTALFMYYFLTSNSSCIYRIPSACWDTACLFYILLQGDYLPFLGWFTGRYLVVVSLRFISLIVILFYVVLGRRNVTKLSCQLKFWKGSWEDNNTKRQRRLLFSE